MITKIHSVSLHSLASIFLAMDTDSLVALVLKTCETIIPPDIFNYGN